MNWEAIAALAELLAALGVIASLVYLATQVRGSARQSRLAAAQSVQAQENSLWQSIGQNAQLAEVYARGQKGWDHLESEAEMVQLSVTYIAMLRVYEELLNYHSRGLVEEWAWTSMHSIVSATVSSKGFADWWAIRGEWFDASFQAHIVSMLSSRDLLDDHRAVGEGGIEPSSRGAL